MKITAGNLKKGDFILHQNEIWQIQKTDFYSPGKGSALMRTKIKNLVNNKNIDFTFKSNEQVETLSVNAVEMQFLYKDQESLYFMDEKTFNQYSVPLSVVGKTASYLKEGDRYYVYIYDGQALNIRPPLSVRLKVVATEDSVKGDTVSGAKKPATLETGVIVMVPLFIKKGEEIIINPQNGSYVGRV